MTDGIIQNTIDNFMDRIQSRVHYHGKFTIGYVEMEELKKELIEKIKNYELLCEKDNGRPTLYVMKFSLIGDNQ